MERVPEVPLALSLLTLFFFLAFRVLRLYKFLSEVEKLGTIR